MMTDWYQKSINTLQLNGKAERTQEAYTRAVRMLSAFYRKSPDEITEEELEAYFLRRRNVDHWSANTMRICYCGIRFFFVHVLQRHWHLFDILRAKSEARLPAILSGEEVRAILRGVRTPHNHAFLSTVYACGLRLQEAQYLEVSDLDSQRMMVHVHRGKGAKDRFVPLPHRLIERLALPVQRSRHVGPLRLRFVHLPVQFELRAVQLVQPVSSIERRLVRLLIPRLLVLELRLLKGQMRGGQLLREGV